MLVLPLQIASLMRGFKADWFIAGGWALDLFLEKETRPHQDIEIGIFREDQGALHDYFNGWTLKKAMAGELLAWPRNERLMLPTHEIHCFNEASQPPQIEILLNESNKTEWIYRRNPKIRRPLAGLRPASKPDVNFLCPEIVLLYKSKNPRPKDEQDFQTVVEHLSADRKEWLREALKICDSQHPWLRSL